MSDSRVITLGGPPAPVRVVMIDDDPDVRTIARVELSCAEGWELVGEAEDGAQAEATVRQHDPDVVLLDLGMATPGEQALRDILQALPDCMVVVFSSLPAHDHRQRLLALGAFAYYDKSVLGHLVSHLEVDLAAFRDAYAS